MTSLFLATCVRVSAQNIQNHSCDVALVVTRFVPSSGAVELVGDLNAKDLTVKVGFKHARPEDLSARLFFPLETECTLTFVLLDPLTPLS